MVDERRDAPLRIYLIAELPGSASKYARPEIFPSGRPAVQVAVMDRQPEGTVEEKAVAGLEHIMREHDVHRQPRISLAGVAAGVDRDSEMRPEGYRHPEHIERREQRGEQQLGVQ